MSVDSSVPQDIEMPELINLLEWLKASGFQGSACWDFGFVFRVKGSTGTTGFMLFRCWFFASNTTARR